LQKWPKKQITYTTFNTLMEVPLLVFLLPVPDLAVEDFFQAKGPCTPGRAGQTSAMSSLRMSTM
jgi:hypothetical protein